MPLSCKGRYRGIEPSRGDIDDVLGKFVYRIMFTCYVDQLYPLHIFSYSLSLIDALDTLVVSLKHSYCGTS